MSQLTQNEALVKIKKYMQILEIIREIVEEVGPDFVYEKRPTPPNYTSRMHSEVCLYIYENRPDCIVGKILHRLGVSIEDLQRMEGQSPVALRKYVDSESIGIDFSMTDSLSNIQACQDRGTPYGEVLDFAVSLTVQDVNALIEDTQGS